MPERTCPRDATPMRKSAAASIEVDECPLCRGLFFEDQELRLAQDRSDPDLAWLDFEIWRHPERFRIAARPLLCPNCGAGMAGVTYGETEVTVDACTTCRGVWVDRGEFPKLVEALGREVDRKSSGEYLRDSLREAVELFSGPESTASEWKDLKSVLRLLSLRFWAEHPGIWGVIGGLPR